MGAARPGKGWCWFRSWTRRSSTAIFRSPLRALFGLTEAEARLASALVAGKTVEAYARDRGVTVGTARYQLNQVLGKVGARRQADLVRQVLCSAAALVVPGPD
ncbi:hypothetical protein WJ966_02415 [Achromobacter xylosoxidans]